jgi:glycosyltransferase involved in cell wall biosynthesis
LTTRAPERRTIVAAKAYGGLADRILPFAHLVATAIERGLVVLNPAFNEYAHLFPATTGDLLCRFPPGECLPPAPGQREAIRAAARAGADTLHRAQKSGRDVGLIRLEKDEYLDLGSALFGDLLARHAMLVLDGFSFRDVDGCIRHRDAIRSFFTPHARVLQQSREPIEQASRAGKLVVGVHLGRRSSPRRRDEASSVADEVYHRALAALRSHPDGREVAFFVTGDGPVSPELTKGLDVIRSSGFPIEDLYGLAACDYLLGVSDTGSRWAAFYGNVPVHWIGDPAEEPSYDLFRAEPGLEVGSNDEKAWLNPLSRTPEFTLRPDIGPAQSGSDHPSAAPGLFGRSWSISAGSAGGRQPASSKARPETGSGYSGDPSGLVLSVLGLGGFGGMTRHAQGVVEMLPSHSRRWSVRLVQVRPRWNPPPVPRGWQRVVALVEAMSWTRITPRLRKAWPGVPIVVRSGGIETGHALALAADSLSATEYRDWVDTTSQTVDLIIANSQFSAARLAETDFSMIPTAVVTGGAGVPSLGTPRQPSERPVAIIVGRCVAWKGMERGIEAIALAQQQTDIGALVVGDGVERAELEDLARERLRPGTWQFTGALPHEHCLRLIAESDVLVSMSRVERKEVGTASYESTETMGRAICEALLAGVPVVATNVGGVPELIRPGAGTLIEQEDVRAAATAIVSHLRSGRLQGELVDALRQDFGWPAVIDAYTRLFDDLCEKHAGAALLHTSEPA